MLRILEECSKQVFVPLTVGGGIRGYRDTDGRDWTALDVAARYFRAGADKVSIGSDAVYAAETYILANETLSGTSSVECISKVYGKQAVVVSLDPKRVYLTPNQAQVSRHTVIEMSKPGPAGQRHCWYQCTVRGGREGREIDAIQVARASEAMGAGELLLNCVDCDGQKDGYDHDLIESVKSSVTIPVIASSGAGTPEHFTQVFQYVTLTSALSLSLSTEMVHNNTPSIL